MPIGKGLMRFSCRTSVFTLAVSILSTAAAAQADPTTAQVDASNSENLEEIIVTANRREERLQDIPVAISAFNAQSLVERRIEKPEDLAKAVPGLTITHPYGEGNPPVFVLRGVAANDYSQTQARPIALYTDDALRVGSTFEAAPFFDVERVEVLKGPQGALYGKNATGGAIRVITRAAGFDAGGYLTVGYGNYDQREIKAAAQTPIIDGVLAARLALTYTKNDGYVRNLTPGRPDEDQTDVFGIRASFLLRPSDAFEAVLRLSHNRSRGGAGSVLPLEIVPAILGPYNRDGLGYFEERTSFSSRVHIDSYGANLTLNYDLSDSYKLTSVTAGDWGKYLVASDEDGLPVDIAVGNYDVRDASAFYQDLHLTSSYTGPFNWVVGINLTSDQLRGSTDLGLFTDPALGIPDPFGFGTSGFGILYANAFKQKRTGVAGYARGEFEILPSVTLVGGGRYSRDTVRVSDYDAGIASNPGTRKIDTALFSDINRKKSFSNWSFEAGVNWKVTPNILAYSSFKQGYRAGAANAQGFFSPTEVNIVAPEKTDSYEIGLKTELLDKKLTLNVAGFYVDYRDQQVLNTDPRTTLSSLSNVDSRIYGVEIDGLLRISSAFTLNGQLSLLDPKYRPGSRVGVAFDASGEPIAGTGSSIGGNQMIGAARRSAGFGARLVAAELDAGDLSLQTDALYTSRVYYSAFESKDVSNRVLWLINARIGLDGGRISAALWGKNLTAKKYITYANDYRTFTGYIYSHRGAPRTYGVEIGYKF